MSFSLSSPINFSGFTGAGFAPTPGAGQLDSDFWRIQGFSDNAGLMDYGATATTGDYARGVLSGDPTTAGVYAVETGVASLGTSFVIQTTGAEFGTTPGTITLRVQYLGTETLSSFVFDYDGVYRNNAGRSVAVDLSYAVSSAAAQPAAFTGIAALGFSTPIAADAGAGFSAVEFAAQTLNATIQTGDYIFLRWTIGDNGGSGSRDEVGFDNISLSVPSAEPSTAIDLSPGTLNQLEGNSGSTAFSFSVTRADTTPGDTVVKATIASATLSAGEIASVTVDGVPVTGFAFGAAFDVPLTGSATAAEIVVNVRADVVQEANESFTVTLSDAGTGYAVGAATATATVIDDDQPVTRIHDVQGSGPASLMVGQTVTLEGVVTGDYQNGDADGNRNLQGFYLQDLMPDGNELTSEGIFVYQADGAASPITDVRVGDIIRVTGVVNENFNETQLNVSSSSLQIQIIRGGAYTQQEVIDNFALDVNLPATGTITAGGRVLPDLEFAEGMLIRLPQTMTITEMFNLDRYGEIRVAQGGQQTQFAQTDTPDAAGYAQYLQELGARSLLIDDGLNIQNPSTVRIFDQAITTANAPQMGDSFSGLVGNLGYGFNEYRLQTANNPTIVDTAPRSDAPAREGDIRLASANLLNYFTTLADGSMTGPGNAFEPRGATNAGELARQKEKLYTALDQLDADVIVVNELENNGFGPGSAIQTLVDEFNAAQGTPGLWSFVNPGTQYLGGDAIKVSIIYRTDRVQLATGTNPAVLDDSDIPGLISAGLLPADFLSRSSKGAVFNGADTSRAVLVTSFEQLGSGEVFTVAGVHNKSKSGTGTGADADQLDGSGNWQNQRLLAAQALEAFLKTNPTGAHDADTVIMGDFNAYAKETSVQHLAGAGYGSLVESWIGNDNASSYVFDGQKGYLDNALASGDFAGLVVGVHEWHLNAQEADLLDYNTDFGRPTTVFDPNSPVRYSDHDPVIVDLLLDGAVQGFTGGVRQVSSNTIADASRGLAAGSELTIRKASAGDLGNAGIHSDGLTVNTGAATDGFFVLAETLQRLGFSGTGHVDAVGNALANTLAGNDGDNTLAGKGGDDSILGGGGNDLLFGEEGDDELFGNDGDDTLLGGAGHDLMAGGLCNDAYLVEDAGDVVQEAEAAGTDTVFVAVDGWTAGANIEFIRLTAGATSVTGGATGEEMVANAAFGSVLNGGGGDDTLWGQNGADTLLGGEGDDTLRGGAGNDTLEGGAGNDKLVGGAGADIFVAGPGTDELFDFSRAEGDRIDARALGLTSADMLTAEVLQVGGGGTLIHTAFGQMGVYGVTDLRAEDFIFA
ncbi:ExeM/NucH family extracellular endonuclease [Rhodovarius crocodyli]|uniref:ExeM/NucH family extracellular endonuclease n=1 Tax=Rhodovarius crocodyli TaxID=1979269 RepID=A0A437MMW8_9PROT|nr:ExeM/NucH family extracellular endonuclease [Rhodovarius crocodyli]RVT98989.1 ExeM/NucH family extracellular endonuclease [Rhodovarius crocodyli]